jgi:cysteine desulfurase
MGKAAELALAEMPWEAKRLMGLRDKLIDTVLRTIPTSHLNGSRTKRLPQNANMRFSYIEGEALILNLDMVDICTSTSSACTSKTLEPSHVLRAMGIPHEEAHSALLLNLGRWSTEEDVALFIKELPEIVKRLREMSPLTPPGLYKDGK